LSEEAFSPRELLEYLAEGLVDDPERVAVKEVPAESGGATVLELTVGPDDYGNVIGRGGRTATALRTIIKAAASATGGGRVFVDIVDD
jgi:predicted RNA-binding protein YlqC (UPF0109 family)